MASVSVRPEVGGPFFLAACRDYITIVQGDPPYRVRLLRAIEATPGAHLSGEKSLGWECDTGLMEDDKELFEFLLEPTPPNVAALTAANFHFDRHVVKLAKTCAGKEAVARIKVEEMVRCRAFKARCAEMGMTGWKWYRFWFRIWLRRLWE